MVEVNSMNWWKRNSARSDVGRGKNNETQVEDMSEEKEQHSRHLTLKNTEKQKCSSQELMCRAVCIGERAESIGDVVDLPFSSCSHSHRWLWTPCRPHRWAREESAVVALRILPREASRHVPWDEALSENQDMLEGYGSWPRRASESSQKCWRKWLGWWKSCCRCLGCCFRDPAPDKAKEDENNKHKMDKYT